MTTSATELVLHISNVLADHGLKSPPVPVLIAIGRRLERVLAVNQGVLPASAPLTLTDAQIDVILDAPGGIDWVIANRRERLRMFARAVLQAASTKKSDVDQQDAKRWRFASGHGFPKQDRYGWHWDPHNNGSGTFGHESASAAIDTVMAAAASQGGPT